jgi:hypothetical protein
MTEYVIARGYVPEVGSPTFDESQQTSQLPIGWLRVAEASGPFSAQPDPHFGSTFRDIPLRVELTTHAERKDRVVYEHPIAFIGHTIIENHVRDVTGIHFRSGRLRGEANIGNPYALPDADLFADLVEAEALMNQRRLDQRIPSEREASWGERFLRSLRRRY